VEEFIRDGANGLLVDFFDSDALVDKMCLLLEDRALAVRLGTAARAMAVERYDLATVCLPQQLAWLDEVARD
jgi:glycosyltransferase involved in cell wall biosynthesis